MSRKEKLLQRIRQNPRNVRFRELDQILSWHGFQRRQTKGGSSHYVYTITVGNETYPITVPYKRPFLKQVYVKNVLKLIDDLNLSLDN